MKKKSMFIKEKKNNNKKGGQHRVLSTSTCGLAASDILDGACLSISSWHILLKCSHRLFMLILMVYVLTSIMVFTASNISDFKFIISAFSQKIDFMLNGSFGFHVAT
jgi:hypothetical protein